VHIQLVLSLLYVFYVCLVVCTYYVCNSYVTYIISTQLYSGQLDSCFEHRYKFEILRSRGNEDTRLTKSRNARSEQLLMMPNEQLTN